MVASCAVDGSLDRAACRMIANYGREAVLVAYTKAVVCEASARSGEAVRWRKVLKRIVAIANALEREVLAAGRSRNSQLH
jgi:hypothetical protein